MPDWRNASQLAHAASPEIGERRFGKPVKPACCSFVDKRRADAAFLSERPDLIKEARFSLKDRKPAR